MYKTSEWVSLGHPDKTADFISCFLLDRFLEKDPMTRYALEVMIKDNVVTLGGEITIMANYSEEDIAAFVRVAVNQIGYTKQYQQGFGKKNTICGDDLVVNQHISKQSADIAQGVDNHGWGDQGVMFGMATTISSILSSFIVTCVLMSIPAYRESYRRFPIFFASQ